MHKILSAIFLAILFIGGSKEAFAQNTYLVFLKDKQVLESKHISAQFTERSLRRRAINNVQLDERDVPVSRNYLNELASQGTILNVSRWLNAVSYSTQLTASELASAFDFVSKIQLISTTKNHETKRKDLLQEKSLNYGNAFEQTNQLNLECLHDQDYLGQGVYLAVIDAGFSNMNTVNYFDSIYDDNRVLDVHNFLDNSTNVYGLSQHGTAVASCIVAHKGNPDSYAGTAVGVDLALYVSEDVSSETELEEFNLVVALERCDSVGVNIANISLGYFEFDDGATSHVYEDLDGATTIASIGVNVAYSKGIFIVTSAGNSGPNTISTPCDANDALCVGAVNVFDDYAFFSSVGPAADGDVKPNVAARGEDTWFIDESGALVQGNGTSFSSPVMSGAVACLMQAHPLMTIQQVKLAIEQSSSQFATPDIFKGYGIPDFCVAHNLLITASITEQQNSTLVSIYPNPSSGTFYIHDEMGRFSNEDVVMSVYDVLGKKLIEQHSLFVNGDVLVDAGNLKAGTYLVLLQSKGVEVRKTVVKK